MRLLLLTLSLLSFALFAKEEKNIWVINPDHSEIYFKVPYLGIGEVTGQFQSFRGQVHFDSDLELANNITLTINPASISTGNSMRDGHLRSSDFLQVDQFKTIQFKSRTIKVTGPGNFSTDGKLQVKGITAPFSINYELSNLIKDSWGNENKFVKFSGVFDRQQFSLNWNKKIADSQFLVGNEIHFWGTFQIQPKKKITPSHNFMLPNTRYIQERERLMRGEITQQQFDRLLETFEEKAQEESNLNKDAELQLSEPKTVKIEAEMRTAAPTNAVSANKDYLWWLAYTLVTCFGLIGVIALFIHTKGFFSDYWKDRYEEVGTLGYLTDLVLYPIGLLYLMALWHLAFNS